MTKGADSVRSLNVCPRVVSKIPGVGFIKKHFQLAYAKIGPVFSTRGRCGVPLIL